MAEGSSFTPATISLPSLQVSLTISNADSVDHNFSIDELNLSQDIRPGEVLGQGIAFPNPDTFRFYCRFHRDQGMVGIVTVTEEPPPSPAG